MTEFPDIPPIDMTLEEAKAIEANIDARLGALDPAAIAAIAQKLDQAAASNHDSARYVAAVAKALIPILKGLVA